MRGTRAALAGLLAAAALGASVPATAATVTVEVANNTFTPQQARVEVGDTIRWNVVEGEHTVSANDGRFDFTPVNEGDEVEWTFTEDETVYYRCKIHAEMFGVIEVGEGSPPPPDGGGFSEVRRVCRDECAEDEWEDFEAALLTAPPRALIELEPGVYTEHVVLQIAGVVLRGVGETPAEVVIDGDDERLDGVIMFGTDLGLEHLTVTGGAVNGVRVEESEDFRIRDVVADGNGATGVLIERSHRGLVADTVARAHPNAGFRAAGCPECDTRFEGVFAEGNFTGLEADDAGSLVVRESTFTDNGTGIALRSTWIAGDTLDEDAPQRGSHVYRNTITANTNTEVGAPPFSATMPLRTGSGIWINAGSFNVIEDNVIDEHLYGVAITGLLGPSSSNEVIGNTITGSSAADVGWDGIGLGTCFAGNAGADGAAISSHPAAAETIYDCGLPATAGIPFPLVDAMILERASQDLPL